MFNHDTDLYEIGFFNFSFDAGQTQTRIERYFGHANIKTVGNLINQSRYFCCARGLGFRSLRVISRRCKELDIPLLRPFDSFEGVKELEQLQRIQIRILATSLSLNCEMGLDRLTTLQKDIGHLCHIPNYQSLSQSNCIYLLCKAILTTQMGSKMISQDSFNSLSEQTQYIYKQAAEMVSKE